MINLTEMAIKSYTENALYCDGVSHNIASFRIYKGIQSLKCNKYFIHPR